MNSWKRLLGRWLIVPIIIGIGSLSLAGTPEIPLPFPPPPESQFVFISDSHWTEAIYKALEISLFPERQEFPGYSVGIRVSYLSPSESRQFSRGGRKFCGLELYGIFDLKGESTAISWDQKPQSPGRFCLEGFINYLPMETKGYAPFPNLDIPDWLSDLTSISLGGSILYKHQERDFAVYFGGGLAYYFNEFKLPRQGKDYARDSAEDHFYSEYEQELVNLKLQEEVENAIGWHLRAGAEIQLSENVFLSLDIKQTFVEADATRKAYARTQDEFYYYLYQSDTEKGEVDLSTRALGIGLSLRF